MAPRQSGFPLPEGPGQTHASSQIIVLLAALLTAGAAIAGLYAQLPWWFTFLIALFALTGVVVLVKEFLWPPISDRLSAAMDRRRLDAASRAVFPEFEDIVRRFQELISTQSSETLPAFFWDLLRHEPAWRDKLPAIPQVLFISELFGPFMRRFREWNGTHEQLKELAQDFWTFLHQYDTCYVFEPLAALRNLKKEELPERLRHKANLLREDYVAFGRDYIGFAKRANAKLGGNPFVPYLRLPEAV